MRRIATWGTGQRIVLVIALGLALAVLGRYFIHLASPDSSYGWFAYAPLDSKLTVPRPGLRPVARLGIWLAMLVIWSAASFWLLRPARDQRA